jgi:hypothetical protein
MKITSKCTAVKEAFLKERTFTIILMIMICMTIFIISSGLLALYMSIFEWMRSSGLGFWTCIFSWAFLATALSIPGILSSKK